MELLVLHAAWGEGAVHLWGESLEETPDGAIGWRRASGPELIERLGASAPGLPALSPGKLTLLLPSAGGNVLPSPRLSHWIGSSASRAADSSNRTLAPTPVETASTDALNAPAWLDALDELGHDSDENQIDFDAAHDRAPQARVIVGDSVRFFAAAARMARSLLAEQRFVPMALQDPMMPMAPMRAAWQAWLSDEQTLERVRSLLSAMPPAARAAVDKNKHQAVAILSEMISAIVDAFCRAALRAETMSDALDGRDSAADPHVGLLTALLDDRDLIDPSSGKRFQVPRVVRRWIGGLEERGASGTWRLCVRLSEPQALGGLRDLAPPPDEIVWVLSIHLQSIENESILLDAEDIWSLHADSASVEGQRIEQPQELLLGELGRASRLWKPLEGMLAESTPTQLELTTKKAYEFLREVRPIMLEQGFGVISPDWWDTPGARLGARLKLDSSELPPGEGGPLGPAAPTSGATSVGLSALVSYQWQLAIGDTSLSLEEFEALAARRAPLVRIGGRWVEVRPEDVRAAMDFIKENPGGQMRVGEALRLAFASEVARTGVPILGIDSTGWIADVLNGSAGDSSLTMLKPPEGFHGELRPYQLRGLSWLAFLDRVGLGPCLADDMGLGKTIQLLAMLLHERQRAEGTGGAQPGPTLLIVPMSIVGNWKREAQRFAPSLRVLVHHGAERTSGEAFLHEALNSDLIITTYALAHRDSAELERIPWHRIVLDEAQNIKNPAAKQSRAIRALDAPRRMALTGTPLENRLSELWSILEFCNPGLLGTGDEFRRTFAVPVERYHDRQRSKQLKSLVRPFILRRLKTDPSVISDLPNKLETKEFCRLTTEQASLYETCVKTMLAEVERAEGIRRRGIVLTTLIRLKQICNHPAQFLNATAGAAAANTPKGGTELASGEDEGETPDIAGPVEAARSGKCIRLVELLDEVMSSGERALIFTQFRAMGSMLTAMLRHAFDKEVLFLHGGVPQKQRDAMVARFQKGDGTAPLFVLSLKAGGVGLNLTAATHVFHFDRWWNPAVENQATDRAFRIGQTKTVNVHKFVVAGSLEERIDQMIESKTALAEDVIGSGEEWLTELSTAQLRELLTLRPDAVGDE